MCVHKPPSYPAGAMADPKKGRGDQEMNKKPADWNPGGNGPKVDVMEKYRADVSRAARDVIS